MEAEPRERGRWKACHELLRLETEAAWRCKHCLAHFTNEAVQHGPLPICPGPAPDGLLRVLSK